MNCLECKNAAGEVMKFKDKWTHTVDGLCYECMCKQHNTASCKAAKPCKKQCASEEKADSRKCCSCGSKYDNWGCIINTKHMSRFLKT